MEMDSKKCFKIHTIQWGGQMKDPIYNRNIRLLALLAALIIVVFTVSCDRRTSNPLRPDFNSQTWLDSFDYALSIGVINAKDRSSSQLRSKTEPISPTLSLNGNAAIAGEVSFNDLDEYWYVSFPFSSAFAGSVVEYELNFSGKRYTGNLLIPTSLSVAFPFFQGQFDYSFSWATATNPHTFVLALDYIYNNEFKYIRRQIIGNQRSHTLSKSLWNGNAIDVQNLNLRAINYSTKTKNMIVYAQVSAS